MPSIFSDLLKDLKTAADQKQAAVQQKFFKTGKGEYGEGDVFLGITVPIQRKIAKKYSALSWRDLSALLKSDVHERRSIALVILVDRYMRADEKQRARCATFYLSHLRGINNWDLVDGSASHILGRHAYEGDTRILYRLARSRNFWHRRIAIVATHYFIRQGRYDVTLAIATILLNDKYDLIHKAVGWMLREVFKKSPWVVQTFLEEHCAQMPRTMLRSAIERCDLRMRARLMNAKKSIREND